LATALVLLSITVSAAACGGSTNSAGNGDGGVIITPLGTRDQGATPGSDPTGTPSNGVQPAPTNEPVSSTLSGFVFPIQGGCLPAGDQLMPNAPREYRNGTHEGVDFYGVDNCTAITVGTPVVAAKGGVVIHADLDYVDLTIERYNELTADLTSAASLDAFRGRQVWIDHGNGIVTRYCHLSAIAAGLSLGTAVNAGDLVAFVGESGTPESINNPGSQYHLHFEVRVGESYLGAGLPPEEVRGLYIGLFGQ
jgi:murein DD-endopeptidase MepM/ murein hydrolase activator NlpD